MDAIRLNYRSGTDRPRPIVRVPVFLPFLITLGIFGFPVLIGLEMGREESREARIAAAKTDIANLDGALTQFQADVGRWPTTAEGLNALIVAPFGTSGQWHGPYVARLPPSDPWNHAYLYLQPGTAGTALHLFSCGEDGLPNTPDDIGI